jgi:hypothetical protein
VARLAGSPAVPQPVELLKPAFRGPLGSASRSTSLMYVSKIFVKVVIRRHVVTLAALFVQPDPSAPSLDEVVFHFHSDRGADAARK